MDKQLEELLTGYGELGGIWFDGWWDKPEADWRLGKTYGLIHRLQPAALVGANHHRRPFPGEDFQMFEKDLPGHNTAGFNEQSELGELPFEMCDTINNSWGYNKTDGRHKSTKQLVQLLVKAAGYDANFLLNVGPRPDGTIQPEHVSRLAEVGQWLQKNGETIYGTRGGPLPPRPWGVTTRKGDRVFVHVLDRSTRTRSCCGSTRRRSTRSTRSWCWSWRTERKRPSASCAGASDRIHSMTCARTP
jgi:alpha-L-fucosidase